MSTKRSKRSIEKSADGPARSALAPDATTREGAGKHNLFAWLLVGVFALSFTLPLFLDDSADAARADLPFIENAKGPEAYRLLADGSLPDRSTAIALAADGMVTINGARHPIDRVGELLLVANRVAMDLVVVEVQADVSPAQASQIVRVLTESGAAKTVTLKRAS